MAAFWAAAALWAGAGAEEVPLPGVRVSSVSVSSSGVIRLSGTVTVPGSLSVNLARIRVPARTKRLSPRSTANIIIIILVFFFCSTSDSLLLQLFFLR